MLKLIIQNRPDVTVLRCSGRILYGDGADTLLRTVMAQDRRNLQIDLVDVDGIDASGLGALVALERWAIDGNRTLHLTNLSKRVADAIETTRLTSVLPIDDNAQECDDAA